MRVHLFVPTGEGRFPGVVLYSEIFQVTGPIRRMAAALAGEGYLVSVPEVYHEFEPPGKVLAYDTEGSERGNFLKYEKELASYDEDNAAAVSHLLAHPSCTGRVATFGICLGGHLAVRGGFDPRVCAVVAFYPTDIHTSTLGRGKSDDTLERLPSLTAPLLLIWGRQDPHIPLEGRRLLQRVLDEAGTEYEWHEFNAAHAFLRDEGVRYNPALARQAFGLAMRFLSEKTGAPA